MNSILFLILIFIAAGLLYWNIYTRNPNKDIFLAVCLSIFGTFLMTGVAALGLVIMHRYHLNRLNITILVIIVLLLLYSILNKRKTSALSYLREGKHTAWILFSIAVIILFVYITHTTEYLIGGRDPGVYNIQGSVIANTGGLLMEDEFFNQNYNRLRGVALPLYPGFYSAKQRGLSEQPGRLIPQFLPFFPSLLAVGYSIAGVIGMLKINAVIALLALLSVYIFARELIGRKGAMLAVVLLALNPAQLWSARITQTELLSQFLFFLSMAVFVWAYKRNNVKLAVLSGLLLGIGCFNRIDSYLFGLGVYFGTAYILLIHKNKWKIYAGILVPFSLLMGLSMLYGYFFSHPYYQDLWRDGSLSMLFKMNVIFAALVPAALIIRWGIIDRHSTRFRGLFLGFIRLKRTKLPWITGGVLLILFLFAYFIRPVWFTGGALLGTEEYFRAHALLEFGFYVPEIAMLLTILGIALMVRDKAIHPYIIFIIISMISLIGYIYNPAITPDHLWASRRWVTINIPVVFVLTAYAITKIGWNKGKAQKLIQVGIVAMIIMFTISQSGLFLFVTMLQGYHRSLTQAAAVMPDNRIFFTDSFDIASPLTYIYGKNVYILEDGTISPFLVDFIYEEGGIYGIGWPYASDIAALFKEGISVEKQHVMQISGRYPKKNRGSYPTALFNREYDLSINYVAYQPGKLFYTYNLLNDFYTQNGVISGEGHISSAGEEGDEGFLLFGNYTALDEGRYTFDFSGELFSSDGQDIGFADIMIYQGNQQVIRINLEDFVMNGQLKGTLTFNLEEAVKDLELRIYHPQGVRMRIQKVILTKENDVQRQVIS